MINRETDDSPAHAELAYPRYDLPDPDIFAKMTADDYTVTVSDLAAR